MNKKLKCSVKANTLTYLMNLATLEPAPHTATDSNSIISAIMISCFL